MIGVVAPVRATEAASLTVAPISIDLQAPAQSATLTLQNHDGRAVNAQVRIFRWSQPAGEDKLEPTTAVVASPPIVQIGPKGNYVVRLLRAASDEPPGEEAYRIIVDELPDLNRQRNGAVNVLLRYSVPLFFGTADATPPQVQWSLGGDAAQRVISAKNDGDKRIQITGLAIKAGQKTVSVAPGLAGYVLGHSTRTWKVPGRNTPSGPTHLTAGSDHGAISVSLAP